MTRKQGPNHTSSTPRVGIQWPPEIEGTTKAAKKVWCAAANAAKDSQLAEEIEHERNWRFKYQKHLAKLGDVTASCSKENANIIATAGLNQLLESFVFVENDTNDPTKNKATNLIELGSTPYSREGKRKFKTHIIEGEKSIPSDISFPYKNETLDLSSLEKKMAAWVEYGTCEPDCCPKVSRVMPSISEGLLKGKWFVLLGAGSEMGPLKFLLTFGANVIAIRTRKKSGWIEMGNFAIHSAGKLFIPLSEIANENPESGNDTKEWHDMAGCDILTETLDIRDWVIDVMGGPSSEIDLTVGLYTYLDSEAHVRVTLGCDVIMTGLEKAFPKTRFAYIGSTSVSTAISKAMYTAVEDNRAASAIWMKATRCKAPNISKIENVLDSQEEDKTIILRHGFVIAQGPNYALAKTAQVWRAMIANNYPSFCAGPITKTVSVVHNPTMAAMLNSFDRVKPYEIMDPPCASTMLGLLLSYDILFEKLDKDKETGHPLERTLGSAFHSGDLRGPYDFESSKCLSGAMYLLGRYC